MPSQLLRRVRFAVFALVFVPGMLASLGRLGQISNVIGDEGGPTSIHPRVTPKVTRFP